MKLVMQYPHSEACGHACVAMVADVTLDDVIERAGGDRLLGEMMMRELLRQFGCPTPDASYLIEALGSRTIAALHRGDMYDPWLEMNPTWPWHRYIAIALPVEAKADESGR